MSNRKTSIVAAAAVALVLTPCVSAALVSSGSGEVELELEHPTGSVVTETFPVAFPEAETRQLTGEMLDEDTQADWGFAEASYSLQTTEREAVLEAAALTDNGSMNLEADGGHAIFRFDFTLARPAYFTFTADLLERGPVSFSATLDDVIASASYFPLAAADDLHRGTFPIIRDEFGNTLGFGVFSESGLLAAGDHTFTVQALAATDRGTPVDSAGTATIELAAIPEPTTGLLALGMMGLLGLGHRSGRRPRGTA